MKFAIVNSFHRDDKGDAALLHVLMDQLLAIDPHADITVSSMEDPRDYATFYKGRNIGSFELQSSSHIHPAPLHLFFKVYIFFALSVIGAARGRFSWLLSGELKKIYREYRSADMIVSVGGGYFITKHDLGSRMHLLFALQTLTFCKRLGKVVVTAPVSVGPFQKSFEAAFAKKALQTIDLLLLREGISEKYFLTANHTLPQHIKRAPDSGFVFSPPGSFDLRALTGRPHDERILVLAVRNWTKAGRDAYERAHANLIDHIAEHYPSIRPVFVPQCTFPYADDDDRTVAKKIVGLSKTKRAFIIDTDLDYQQVKLSYRGAAFVVGTRFHSMVFGLAYGVPGVAIEYEHKTRGIMRELGLEEWVIPIGEITPERLIALFDRMLRGESAYRRHLVEIMPAYQAEANKVVKLFSAALGRKVI
jgi:colanic acid/amylovoran biosynthesis protein